MTIAESVEQSGECKALIVPGGNNAPMLRCLALLDYDIVIVVDAPRELARNLPDPLPSNVIAFPLGEGHTARTLAARASPAVQECVNRIAGMDADAGLGQNRGIGALAAKLLLRSADWQDFLRYELFDRLVQRCGRIPDRIHVEAKGSLAGGTASAVVFVLSRAIGNAMLKRTNATVATELTLTGGQAYAGCGRRVHRNSAAGTVDALEYALEPHQHPRMIRSLRLLELPPVGTDWQTRSRHMLEIETALKVETVRTTLDQYAPNNSADGPLGNITLWQSGHFRPLHPRFDVARDIAPAYSRDLHQAVAESKAQPATIERLYLDVRREPLPREDLDALAERMPASDPDELLATATLPAEKLRVAVHAVLRCGDTLSLSEPQSAWGTSPSTLAEARERLIIQASCLHALQGEIGRLHAELAQTDRQRRLIERQLARGLRRLQYRGYWSLLRGFVLGAQQDPQDLAGLVRDVRAAADQARQLEGMLVALKDAYRQVEAERDFIVSRIRTIIARLDALVPGSHRQQGQATVVPRQIDTVFSDLWRIDDHVPDEDVARLLQQAVARVTMHGLAKIVRAEPGRLEAIARQIAHRRFASRTPPWGGKPRSKKPVQIHVLPPSNPDMAEKLQQLIHDINPRSIVAVAEQMAASINCVTLDITTVDRIQDVLPNYLRRNLLDAYHEKHREMYFPFGTSPFAASGIVIDGQVKFQHTTKHAKEE